MKHNTNTINEKDIVLWVNISLFGVASLLVFYYVMTANSITSKSYRTQVLQDKVEALTEINGTLMSKKLVLETPASLLEFAHNRQLVEAKNVSYIFEGKNVALKK